MTSPRHHGAAKSKHDVLKLCALAAERLKKTGFVIVAVSMKSEAVYFRFPGRHGLLRVSTHKSKEPMIGFDHIVSRLTFRGNRLLGPSILVCGDDVVENMIASAIGVYMLGSSEPFPSAYKGKRGTWETTEKAE